MKNQLLLMLISVIFFVSGGSSCNRTERDITAIKVPGNAVIKGRFTAENGTVPLKNVLIEVYWKASSGDSRKKNTIRTDENGYYDIRVFVRPDEINNGYFTTNIVMDNLGYDYSTQLDPLQTNSFQLSDRSSLTRNYNFEKRASLSLNYASNQMPAVGTKYQVQVFQDNAEQINRGYYGGNYLAYASIFVAEPITGSASVAANTPLRVVARVVSSPNTDTVISEKVYNLPAIATNTNRSFDVVF